MPYRPIAARSTRDLSTGWPVTCSTVTSAAPGIPRTTPSISRAVAFSTSRSSPKTLMPTSPRTPAIISFTRISMGCRKDIRMPGMSSSSAFISAASSSCVAARFQRSRGWSVTKTSVSSSPIGSVATSAVPVRDQTRFTSSGNFASSTFSMRSP